MGVLVSQVDPGSQANRKGLNVGDMILRINGHDLAKASHKKALRLISMQRDITMTVKYVGKLPYIE